ncbi:MAG TPA: hypothetical protein VGG48_16160 [Rhizomicrobium sp.]|jgi:hypothetical protein
MRAAILASILALAATGVSAKPPTVAPDGPSFSLKLPSESRFYARSARQSDTFAPDSTAAAQPGGVSLGFVQAEAVRDDRPGKHRSVMQYRLNGVQVMGGAVGGSLDGRGAVVTLHWPGQ